MSVWLVIGGSDHEGSYVIAVYSKKRPAKVRATVERRLKTFNDVRAEEWPVDPA